MATSSVIFEKLNDLLKFGFPFEREETVVCFDNKDIMILNDYMKEHKLLPSKANEVESIALDDEIIIQLPIVLGIKICSKSETTLIQLLRIRYNIVIMPTYPFESVKFMVRNSALFEDIMPKRGEIPYCPKNNVKQQTYCQILMNRDQVWKLDTAIRHLKEYMLTADKGHLKNEESEMIWDKKSFVLRLFDVGASEYPESL